MSLYYAEINNYGQDSDGDGLPDWWELKYSTTSYPLSPTNADTGNTGIPDGYKQSCAGDGWNNLQKLQMGVPPCTWVTPPPATGITIQPVSGTTNDVISWQPAGGPVVSYGIENGTNEIALLSSNTLSYTFGPTSPSSLWTLTNYAALTVRAYYANGTYSESALATSYKTSLDCGMTVVPGTNEQGFMVLSSAPTNLSYLLLYWADFPNFNFGVVVYSATNLVGGIGPFPVILTNNYGYLYYDVEFENFQTVDTDGKQSELLGIGSSPEYDNASDNTFNPTTNYVDVRQQLKQNLKFLLREATTTIPFSYFSSLELDGTDIGDSAGQWEEGSPEYYYTRGQTSTNYEYYGIRQYMPDFGYSPIMQLRPIQDNYMWRNFVINSADYSDGVYDTGATDDNIYGRAIGEPKYVYTGSGTELPLPLAFTLTNSAFLIEGINASDGDPMYYDLGITNIDGLNYLPVSQNIFGLALDSVMFGSNTFTPGQAITNNYGTFAVDYASPDLHAVDYYFASQTAYLWDGAPLPALPGAPTFSITNKSPLLVTAVGNGLTVSAWAKETITAAAATNAFAYEEQYLDAAFTMTTNNVPTTNPAAVVSPYGNFFPTVAGPAALVTMPDIETGQQGTNIIYVIKLQLDVNHDGTMDTTLQGLDNTFPDKPYQFWVNNNFDRWTSDVVSNYPIEDDVETAGCPFAPKSITPDCSYLDTNANRVIPCQRDLADFARLWVAGVTPGLLTNLPSGSTITLNWGDVGSPNTNNPTIDLFQAADTNGGTGYQTNATIASQQTNSVLCPYIGRIGPGSNLVLNASTFSNSWAGNYFIWCGVTSGTGALTLTITDGSSNTLAQSTAYIQLQDIKQMYERWTVGDAPSQPPATTAWRATEGLSPAVEPFQYPLPTGTNTPYILFVHGYNLALWDKDRFAESAFKRLYWQGYQGRFGLFRWPTFDTPIALFPSEFQAWKSGTGLFNQLTALNAEYPGHVYVFAHSMGNVVTGQALLMAGTNQLVNTYIASQAAVSARAYDNTLPTDATNYYDPVSPDSIGNYYTSNAPSYFHGSAGAGTYANFYNPVDWALMGTTITLFQIPVGWLGFEGQKIQPYYLATNYPEAVYFYTTPSTNHPSGYFYQNGTNNPYRNLLFTNDTFEIFAYCDQSYSLALGAETNVAGAFTTGRAVNLNAAPYNFGDLHVGHSWQFRSDYQSTFPYWHQLLSTFQIQP